MKICLYSWENITDVFARIGSVLNSATIEIVHVTYSSKEDEKLHEFSKKENYIILNYLKKHWETQLNEEFQMYQEKYSLPPLMKLVYADRFIREYRNFDTVKRFIILHLRFWESFFQKERPEYLVGEAISGLSIYLAYLVGIYYGCVYLGITHSRIPGKHYITEDEYGYSKKTEFIYRNDIPIPEEKVCEFITKFRREKTKPSYMLNQGKPPVIGKISNIIPYIKLGDSPDYFYTNGNLNLFGAIKKKVSQKLRYYILSKFKTKIFHRSEKEKFLLYPVHFQPEASTMVQAPFFENQLSVIENIARSLPVDIKLYVKDHYAALGSKYLTFYKRIKELPNVKLIDPFIDSHALIQQSEAVITITGTVGWEAILYDKPVIIFGDVYYDICEHVTKVTCYNLLPKIINNTIYNSDQPKDSNLKFIGAYLESLYEGEFDVGNLEVTNLTENIQKLADGLLQYIEERKTWA